jgi:Domain of unknown function (DUF4399)
VPERHSIGLLRSIRPATLIVHKEHFMKHVLMSCVAVALAMAGLAGCANNQAAVTSSAPTAPMKVNASTPTLAAGYVKVAATPGSSLYFVNLKNGDTVSSPVLIQFGLRGMGVAPAGIEKAGTGHHHLLIDVAELDVNSPIPTTDQHRHFGLGQTEVTLEMTPGKHTLQLLMGDQNHIPHHPVVMSERITITVK